MAIINSAGFIQGEATDEWSSLYFDFLYFTNMKREKIQIWIPRTHLHPAPSYIVYSWIVFPKQTIQWYESTTNLSISRNKIANNNVLSTNVLLRINYIFSHQNLRTWNKDRTKTINQSKIDILLTCFPQRNTTISISLTSRKSVN